MVCKVEGWIGCDVLDTWNVENNAFWRRKHCVTVEVVATVHGSM